ncbi:hypothetical protein [Deinococcus planocerae]|nr:hypothetical protein [Deinococcus planocerae]
MLFLRDVLTTANLPVGIVTGLGIVLVVLLFWRGLVAESSPTSRPRP